MQIDWNHVYILGSEFGLTTWMDGPDPVYVDVVVIGCLPGRVPYWWARPPDGARIEPMPSLADHDAKVAYAHERGGVYAFGWYLEEPFHRACRECLGKAAPTIMWRGFTCPRCGTSGRDPELLEMKGD